MKAKFYETVIRLGLTIAVAAAVILVILVPFAFTRDDPMGVISAFLFGPFESLRRIGNIVEAATPIALTGLAATLIFRAGSFNLGMEGAVFIGGLAATAAALGLGISGPLAAVVATLIGAIAGSFCCTVPAALNQRFGASEMVTSLVLNYVALFGGLFLLNYFLRDPNAGALMSHKLPADARLDRIISGTRVNIGAVIALVACGLATLWLYYTRAGLNLRITGSAAGFAAHLGLPGKRILMQAQIAGGLIAGMAGAIEVLGLYTRFSWTTLPGLGWSGLIVAILARDTPLLCIPAALFLAWLQVGADVLSRSMDIPTEFSGLMTAAIMLAMTAGAVFRNPKLLQMLRDLRQKEAV